VQAKRVAWFTRLLTERAAVPVTSVDERYSSVQAERLLRESGTAPSKNKARVDSAAAAVILQSYLDSKRIDRSP
jgi:putative Holliday junction resolvase